MVGLNFDGYLVGGVIDVMRFYFDCGFDVFDGLFEDVERIFFFMFFNEC